MLFRIDIDNDESWNQRLSLQLRQVPTFPWTMFQLLSTGGVKFLLLSAHSRTLCFPDSFLFSYCPWPDVRRMCCQHLLIAISLLWLFPSMWTNTGLGKLKRHDFLLEAHDLRESCAPLTYSFKSEVRQGILAVGTHDRQGGRERLKKEPQQDTTPETPPHSHLLPPARCQLPVLTPLLQTVPDLQKQDPHF